MTAIANGLCTTCGHDINQHAIGRGRCLGTNYNPSTHDADKKCGCEAFASRELETSVPALQSESPTILAIRRLRDDASMRLTELQREAREAAARVEAQQERLHGLEDAIAAAKNAERSR